LGGHIVGSDCEPRADVRLGGLAGKLQGTLFKSEKEAASWPKAEGVKQKQRLFWAGETCVSREFSTGRMQTLSNLNFRSSFARDLAWWCRIPEADALFADLVEQCF
jgi:hypothetical protein